MLRKLVQIKVSKSTLKRVINTSKSINSYSLEKSQIEQAVQQEPLLRLANDEVWERSHKAFVNHGIRTQDYIQMVISNPLLVSRIPQQIVAGFENWRGCQFGEKYLHLLLIKHPQLLNVTDGHHIINRVTFLKEYSGTTKNVWKLLMSSPNLISDSKRNIEEKFDYLIYVMRLEVSEISKSNVFSIPLDELKCRHKLLERLGLFKPKPLKADPNEPTKNPRLHQIVDSSEKTFANKVAMISLGEFEAFKELYKHELNSTDGN